MRKTHTHSLSTASFQTELTSKNFSSKSRNQSSITASMAIMAPYLRMARQDQERHLPWVAGMIGKIEESSLESLLISSNSLEGGIRNIRMSFKSHSSKFIIKMPTICSMRDTQRPLSIAGQKYTLNNEDYLYGRWVVQFTNEKRRCSSCDQWAIGFKLSYDGKFYEKSQCN